MANPKVFFDTTVDRKVVGRIVMELFAPTRILRRLRISARYVRARKALGKLGKPLHYKGSIIHHMYPNYMFYVGDITAGDGSGGESIYGDRFFEDENFINRFTVPGMIVMANRGPDTKESQFTILLREDKRRN